MQQESGEFLYHTSCDACGSTDANAVYSNDTSYCWSCRTWATTKASNNFSRKSGKMDNNLLEVSFKNLSKRKIPLNICNKYRYGTAVDKNGNSCQVANYYDKDKNLVAQKLRYPDKTFKFIGSPKEATLFGMNLWGNTGKKIVITEGELDALSVATAFDGKYPVVSIKNGIQSAKKELALYRDYFEGYEEIYLWFDNDEQGNKGLKECLPIFTKDKIKIIKHETFKDASEVLVKQGTAGIVTCFYNAESYKPDNIDTPSDFIDDLDDEITMGFNWCYDKLTALTYGRRFGEIVTLGAGVSVGKTDFVNTQIAYDITVLNEKVGTFMLEQPSKQTLLRVAGKVDGVQYHLPKKDMEIDKERLKNTVKTFDDKLYMYNNFGSTDSDDVIETIHYMFHNYGVRIFYLDNLTSLTAGIDDERRHLDKLMADLAGLAESLNIWILAISHLNPPKKGASHEMGGKVEQNQFTGSRAIMRWSWLMLGVERNTLHEIQAERNKGLVRIVKDRYGGTGTGNTVSFMYDSDTGLCLEMGDEDFQVEADVEDESEQDF